MQQIAGLVIVALHDVAFVINILTGTGAVDTDVARETHIDISLRECSLIGGNSLVECLEGVVPGRTECHQQYGNVLLGLSLLGSHQIVVDGVLGHDVVLLVVVVTAATSCERGGYQCKSHCSQNE